MLNKVRNNSVFRRIIYFFPFQLLFLHIKRTHILLIFWILLFGFVTRSIGDTYGVPDLFLYPEYLGKVNIWSYIILGFSCGGFIMAFNISSYIINGFRFPFLATLSKPFVKYCLNNSIIPVAFVLTYIYFIILYQFQKELQPLSTVLINVSGFIIGNLIFLFLAFTYFLSTDKDMFKLFGIKTDDERKRRGRARAVDGLLHKSKKWNIVMSRAWMVETYISNGLKLRLARDCSHYDKNMLDGVFKQNHINAAFFEIIVLISLIVLGLFREIKMFMIPAGATVFLMFTMFFMISSALHSWLRGWATAVYVALFFLFNFLSGYEYFNYENQIFGMNYHTEKPEYSNQSLKEHCFDKYQQKDDFINTIKILYKWKLKNINNSLERKKNPKLVMICTSGGGVRASLWTFHVLQYADSVLNGELLNHTQLMSGSSGGLIGAAYMRELYLQSQKNEQINLYNPVYKEKIASDLLNPLSFTIATNDLFLRLQKYQDGNYSYTKNRGYAFEKQLNENTDYAMNKRLRDYRKPEANAEIPMMVFCPTVINDGRRIIIASQPVAYLTDNTSHENIFNNVIPECIEFSRFFKEQDAENTQFTSALRMNATFPFILPVTTLPSNPTVEVMDGGIRDNYGMKTALKFLYVFRKWISENTSGVVIIQIRDKMKDFPVEDNPIRTNVKSIMAPLGSFYDNFDKIQTYNHDELIQYANTWFQGNVDVIDFQLKNDKKRKISLSFHLTTQEKNQILDAINTEENQKAIKKLKGLIE